MSLLMERQKVDRRRVEDAFFQYALLRASSWYPRHFCIASMPLHADAMSTISKFTRVYHGVFMQRYSGVLQVMGQLKLS
jgi:hypothetical protein